MLRECTQTHTHIYIYIEREKETRTHAHTEMHQCLHRCSSAQMHISVLTFSCVCVCVCAVRVQIGAIALTCAALIPQLGKSLLVFNLLLLNFVLFTGFLVRKSSITWVFRWITYISPMR